VVQDVVDRWRAEMEDSGSARPLVGWLEEVGVVAYLGDSQVLVPGISQVVREQLRWLTSRGRHDDRDLASWLDVRPQTIARWRNAAGIPRSGLRTDDRVLLRVVADWEAEVDSSDSPQPLRALLEKAGITTRMGDGRLLPTVREALIEQMDWLVSLNRHHDAAIALLLGVEQAMLADWHRQLGTVPVGTHMDPEVQRVVTWWRREVTAGSSSRTLLKMLEHKGIRTHKGKQLTRGVSAALREQRQWLLNSRGIKSDTKQAGLLGVPQTTVSRWRRKDEADQQRQGVAGGKRRQVPAADPSESDLTSLPSSPSPPASHAGSPAAPAPRAGAPRAKPRPGLRTGPGTRTGGRVR
jgi:hypothetical protein